MSYNYDYREVMYDEIKQFLNYNFNLNEYDNDDKGCNFNDLRNELYNKCLSSDEITGYGLDLYSYDINDLYESNEELFMEVAEERGLSIEDFLNEGEEVCDIAIRCYLLPEIVNQVIDDIENDYYYDHDEKYDLEDLIDEAEEDKNDYKYYTYKEDYFR